MLPLPYKIHIGSVRAWNQTLDYLRWDLFSQQERLAKGCYMGIVSAGELFVVADVELRCIIAQPSANVPKCGYGPVQEHLYDLAPYWTRNCHRYLAGRAIANSIVFDRQPNSNCDGTTIQQFMNEHVGLMRVRDARNVFNTACCGVR